MSTFYLKGHFIFKVGYFQSTVNATALVFTFVETYYAVYLLSVEGSKGQKMITADWAAADRRLLIDY